ncbi:UDP-glucosyltransferase family 1 protein [Theobroma cacao]|uniref:Glycosyltransferase n=1 Tax=Theobroma cacao TaxID=3641 RepID=A0A061FMM7_THECC|nr:UDP-glucosyltransferase family 1 protein [Theobroma cacao]
MEPGKSQAPSPHILIFPLPIQGPVNAMLKLAELCATAGLKVTFLNSEYNHSRLVRFANIPSRFDKYPGFEFRTISDGLPGDHSRSGNRFMEIFEAMNIRTKPLLKDMLVEMIPPVDCIIGDGILEFVLDVANELGIPIINCRTIGACFLWSNYSIPDMIEAGELPIKGSEDMDRPITAVPGMEKFLRCRDLPSFCRASNMSDSTLLRYGTVTRKSFTASGVILNTFEELEGPILSQIRSKCPNVYTIGPLNEHFKTRMSLENGVSSQSSNYFWEVDRSCMSWLDRQPNQSVVYVSFGSIAVMSDEQIMEFWHGLVNSKRRFLWVVRPDSVAGKGFQGEDTPKELVEGTKDRGYIVGWAAQEEVLSHRAVGGFLTHSGWNSTMESIVAGVPMLCWPYFADQQLNSRFVGEVWKLGIDMKDVCDRKVVEKMVNDLMVERKDEFVKSAAAMASLAKDCVSVGGPSYCNFDRLIEDIKTISLKNHD